MYTIVIAKYFFVVLVQVGNCGFQSNFQLMPFDIVNDATGNGEDQANDSKSSGLLKDTDQCQNESDTANDGTNDSDERNQGQ